MSSSSGSGEQTPASIAEQVAAARAQLSSLPPGPVRAAVEEALRTLEAQQAANNLPTGAGDGGHSRLAFILWRRLSALNSSSSVVKKGDAATMFATKPCLALALLIHCFLLEIGFVCDGDGSGSVTPSGESKPLPGFAPPKRDIPPSSLIPDSWLAAGNDGTSTTAAYRFEGVPTTLSREASELLAAETSLKSRLQAIKKGAKLTLACLQVGEQSVILHSSTSSSPSSPSSTSTSTGTLELETRKYFRESSIPVTSSDGAGGVGSSSTTASPASSVEVVIGAVKAALSACLRPLLLLSSQEEEGLVEQREKQLAKSIVDELLAPVMMAPTTTTTSSSSSSNGQGLSSSSSSAASSASSGQPPSKEPPANPLLVSQPRRGGGEGGGGGRRYYEDDEDGAGFGPRFGGVGGGGLGGMGGGLHPPFPPFGGSIGRDDLMPSFGGAVPGGMFYGGGGGGFGGGGGGMLFGPDHPVFHGGPGGLGGGLGRLPPPGVPPGARFDPFGPPGIGEPGEPFRGGGGGTGRGGGSITGLPGPDHLRPPPNEDGSYGDAGLLLGSSSSGSGSGSGSGGQQQQQQGPPRPPPQSAAQPVPAPPTADEGEGEGDGDGDEPPPPGMYE
jgi:PI31 proteasome regulator